MSLAAQIERQIEGVATVRAGWTATSNPLPPDYSPTPRHAFPCICYGCRGSTEARIMAAKVWRRSPKSSPMMTRDDEAPTSGGR